MNVIVQCLLTLCRELKSLINQLSPLGFDRLKFFNKVCLKTGDVQFLLMLQPLMRQQDLIKDSIEWIITMTLEFLHKSSCVKASEYVHCFTICITLRSPVFAGDCEEGP